MLEMWRLGQKPALRLDSVLLSYNIDVDSLQATGWVNVPAGTAKTPDTSGVAGAGEMRFQLLTQIHHVITLPETHASSK